jgi:hypothetical protein
LNGERNSEAASIQRSHITKGPYQLVVLKYKGASVSDDHDNDVAAGKDFLSFL